MNLTMGNFLPLPCKLVLLLHIHAITQIVFQLELNKLTIVKHAHYVGQRFLAKEISMTAHFFLQYRIFFSAPIVRLQMMTVRQERSITIGPTLLTNYIHVHMSDVARLSKGGTHCAGNVESQEVMEGSSKIRHSKSPLL